MNNKYKGLKGAIIVSGAKGAYGGAERHFQGILNGLNQIGCNAELKYIEAEEPSFEAIMNNHLNCSKLNLNEYDVLISTKAPTYAVSHHTHILYLIHTVRVFDDMFEENFIFPDINHYKQRATLHKIELSSLKNIKKRITFLCQGDFINGKE